MKPFVNSVLIILTSINLNGNLLRQNTPKFKEVYKSNELILRQITENSFVHISFLQTEDFGYVSCNGLVVKNGNEVIIFDTPTNKKSTEELVSWVKETLHGKIKAIVPTHFHNDCLGGLSVFAANNIPSYAYVKTVELARKNKYVVPENSFTDSLLLKVGNENVIVKFFGEGHTKDNVVGYFPSENILFGGCLIKELKANKGYLGDANTADWSGTVAKIKKEYPNVKIVVPGHGKWGNKKLLDYTIKLFKAY
jgi:metallo-beta-lactamase class B